MENKKEIVDTFVKNLEVERNRMDLTQSQMAEKLEVSLSTYKNLISGVSTNISIYMAYRVYELTGKMLFELCGHDRPEINFVKDFRNLPKYRQNALLTRLELEMELSKDEMFQAEGAEESLIPLYILTGNMKDGMIYDSSNVQYIDIAGERERLEEEIDCAVRITSNHLHPVYYSGDILLVRKKPPLDGETGIFFHKTDNRIYIRKFRQTNPYQLIPLTDYGKTIYIDDTDPKAMSEWFIFGSVISMKR